MEQLALMEVLPEAQRIGGSILTVTPQIPEQARAHLAEAGLAFPVLFDQGMRVARLFGLEFTLPEDLRELYRSWGIDLQVENGDDSWTLPMPASFVIDPAGTVRYSQVDADYRYRAEPSDYLPIIRELVGSRS